MQVPVERQGPVRDQTGGRWLRRLPKAAEAWGGSGVVTSTRVVGATLIRGHEACNKVDIRRFGGNDVNLSKHREKKGLLEYIH